MKKRPLHHRSPYFFKRPVKVHRPGRTLRGLRPPLPGSQVGLEPILRWEDDGGKLAADSAAQDIDRHHEDQPEKVVDLTDPSNFERKYSYVTDR